MLRKSLASLLAALLLAGVASAQEPGHGAHAQAPNAHHEMWMTTLPGGWHLMGMAHVFPSLTFAAPFSPDSPLHRTELAFPHAAAMLDFVSPGARWVFRFMPNFEGITMPGGEVTLGAWGEGFIDSRHPHTFLHEAMLSFNWWEAPGGALSISAGRGFAPYGTDDPMYRPALKYPTNHHLSQILERWTVNVAYLTDFGLGLEFGLFDGNEPEHPWDVSNIDHFGNSWSARASYRFGGMTGAPAPWEVSASFGRVRETHGAHDELTLLYNAAVRHEADYGFGRLYGLVEASMSDPDHGTGYFSVLGETQLGLGPQSRHRPFYRIEYATRPEYHRGAATGEGFFRYDHDDHAIGATRWLINSVGYGYDLTRLPVSARPFVELSHSAVSHERGAVDPAALFGGTSFWSIGAGVRIFLGGGPMRMGTYGVVAPMVATMREDAHHAHPPHHDVRRDEDHDAHHDHGGHQHPEVAHDAMPHHEMSPEEHRRVMTFFVRLLEDEQVQRRLHADHARHELWEDPAVQRHLATMREAVTTGAMPDHDQMDREGMHRAMDLFVRMLADPEVDARIHADPELHRLWEDPAVQRHIEMMREMHGRPGQPHHHHDH
jgi:hypothetical protein